jgi:hypothetical protein
MQRREVLATIGLLAGVGLAGCSSGTDSEDPAHTVSVYLGNRELTRSVTVTISGEDGTTLFEHEYTLSDSNESNENATFPGSNDPEGILVTVDGTRFERDWPGPDHPELPCEAPTNVGVEIWIEQKEDGSPAIRLEANCQSVTEDG